MRMITLLSGALLAGVACHKGSNSDTGDTGDTGDIGSTTTSDSTDTGAPTDTGTGSTGAPTGDSTSSTTGEPTSGTTGAPAMCPDNLQPAPGSEFCVKDSATPDCALIGPDYHTQVCGVAVLDPPAELGRSMGVIDNSADGPPDLGCFTPANYPKAGASQMADMAGVVRIFSHGCESKSVTIEVFEAVGAGIGPQPLGAAVTTLADCTVDGLATPDADCGTRYECKYTYPGVPTEKQLVVRTRGMFWAPLYEYNVYIPNAELQGGVWTHHLRALATDDYNVFSQVALGGPITPGHGMILGEVHDCGDIRLTDATADIEVPRARLSYFNDDESHPLPDLVAMGTGATGLYAAFDVAAGEVSVAALGNLLGAPKTLGYQRVKVFPDSATYLTFRGVRAFQVSP